MGFACRERTNDQLAMEDTFNFAIMDPGEYAESSTDPIWSASQEGRSCAPMFDIQQAVNGESTLRSYIGYHLANQSVGLEKAFTFMYRPEEYQQHARKNALLFDALNQVVSSGHVATRPVNCASE